MSIPNQSDSKILEEQRLKEEKDKTLFQGDVDFSFLSGLSEEQSERIGATIHLIPVSTERDPQGEFQSAGVDSLDGDILDPEFFGNPDTKDNRILNFRCLIEHEPPKQMLKKYGVDEQREIVFFLPFPILKQKGIVSEWRPFGVDIGDLIVWDGTWYQAWNVHRDHYFGQRDKSHYIATFCNRYRHNSVPTEDIPDPC